MKKFYILVTVLTFLILLGCHKTSEPITEIAIAVNGCKNFEDQNNTITCCLDSLISDSRCPSDATCIWQGTAVARYKISNNSTTHLVTLAILAVPNYPTDTILMGYKFSFVQLLPYPKTGPVTNYKDYIATLKVTKQ